ncbi:hypothetical protein Plec18170_004201 [Paecilomyces lecythidis]
MFRALVGGGRSSSDVRSDSGSKSSRRRATDDDVRSTSSRRSKPSASSSSHKSSRGDDRDRGLGDLSAYSSSSSRKRYAPSMTEGSVASTYVTAEPGSIYDDTNSTMTDRTSRYTEVDNGDDRASEATMRSPRVDSRYGEESRRSTKDRRGKDADRDRDTDSARKERRRTRSGDEYSDRSRAPPTSRADDRFAAAISSPGFSQFPGQYDTTMSGAVPASPASYDPHVPQQFPGQFPQHIAEPYRPPHPAGEAAEYYGDQGESVAQQPGVRPKPPSLIIGAEPHLLPASPVANPPPEPSSMGQVGAAADYYGGNSDNVVEQPSRPPKPSKPSKPTKPSKPNKPNKPAAAVPASALGAATYGIGTGLPSSPGVQYHSSSLAGEGPSPYYATPMSTPGLNGASHSHSNSHATEASLGLAAAGAAAGYMMGHHSSHHDEHSAHYNSGSYSGPSYGIDGHGRPPRPEQYGANGNAALFDAGAAGAAGYGGLAVANGAQYPYAAYNGQQLQPGSLAFHQRHHGPLQRFVNFWRDPEGVGMYEDYTEAIGVCRYCFEPGTSSRDAPRKHNYRRRKTPGDRYANGSRIEKTGRYSSEEESRRRRSKGKSWLAAGLAGGLAGYVSKSLFSNKDFDDTYSVRSGHVTDSRYSMNDSESVSSLGRKSHTSHGVERRSRRGDYKDLGKGSVISKSTGSERSRRRSRSRSRSRERHSGLRDAAIGVAIGSATGAALKSRHRNRSQSPRRRKNRKSSSSSSGSYTDIGHSHARSPSTGFTSFFSASSANRRKQQHAKQRKSFFSFRNSSSSSSDADLAFGSAFLKKPNKLTKSNRSSGSSRSSKKKDKHNVDAEILGLGVTAKAIADAADRRGKHRSGVLVAKDDHYRRSTYASSGQEDDEWEDADSSESSSSVSSALAYGGSALFGSSPSDSGTSKWGWRWGSKKKTDKSKQSSDYLPVAEAAAGAFAGAAIASSYGKDIKVSSQDGSSSVGSLRRVYPQPTSDPSRYDVVQLPSRPGPGGEPQFVRPGPIPLQQPQPITPVSQSVYSTRAEPSPSYAAPSGPPVFADAARYDVAGATPTASGISRRTSGTQRRSDSMPVFPIEPIEESLPSVLKRRTTSKDQASVQFELTKEQADKERRADRLERQKRGSELQESLRWAQEEEERKRDIERRERRREKENESGRRNDEYEARSSASRTDSEREKRRNDSSSWVSAAEGAAIGAAGVAIAEKISETSSERRQKRHEELREKRRAERRRNSETEEAPSRVSSTPTYKNQATSAAPVPTRPVHENYGQFFAPTELRHGSDDRSSRAQERADVTTSELRRPEAETPDGPLPWSIPRLNVIEPTPPQSVSGSVRDTASPVVLPATVQEEEESSEDQNHEKPGVGARVSWGEHRTHEFEVPTPLSEGSSGDMPEYSDQEPRSSNESVITSLKDETADGPKSAETRQPIPEDVPGKRVSGGFEDDIEFAATLAAGAAAAGFDPSVVTDNPAYHRRSSPPGSESKGVYMSPFAETVSDLQRPVPPVQGFVEGEVETPTDNEKPVELITDGKEFSAEPTQIPPEDDKESSSKAAAERSIAREVIEKLNGKRDSWTEDEPRRASDSSPERPTDESNYVSVDEGPPTPKASEQQPKWDTESIRDESRSVASAPVDGSRKSRKSRRSVEDFDAKSETASLDDNDEKKKRKRRSKRDSEIVEEERDESSRRRRKSHRDSGVFDDAGSVASSPAKIDETKEKRKSKDKESEKEKKSGGLFGSLFGSKASSTGEKSSSGEKDKRSSRDVQSEVGVDEYRHKKRSSKHRSSSGDNVLGMSNGASRSLTDLSQVGRDVDRDDDSQSREAGESPRSHRQRKEERRRQRYEDIVDSGRRSSDKDHKKTEDADKEAFLAERPEMPVIAGGDNGASGLDSFADVSRGPGEERFSKQLRSSSESPVSGGKEVDTLARSRSRTVSVSPTRQRRLSAARPSDLASSPTAVPLHFRRPPTSPGVRRSSSMSSPVAQSPTSPSQQRFGHRSRHSTEFKNAREFRPLWLVERHSSGKFDHQQDEPLPSLPSSKTSSRSTSIEDFKSLPSEDVIPAWQTQDVTQMMFDQRQRPVGLRISTKDVSEDTDHSLLGSQQATPTAETFSESVPSVKKEKPKYEFHSPSELLQDPCAFVPLPPSPTMPFLPSAEGSAVGTKEQENEGEIEHQELPSLPESRPSSPTAGRIPAPTQEGRSISESVPQSNAELSSLKEVGLGAGFGAIVDAAVSAAASKADKSKSKPTALENEDLPEIRVDLPTTEEAKARGVDQLPSPLASEQDVSVPADSSEAAAPGVDAHRPLSPTKPGSRSTSPLAKFGGFGDVVDAAVFAAVKSEHEEPSLGESARTDRTGTVSKQEALPTEKTDFASVVDAAVAAATGVQSDTKLPEQDEQLENNGASSARSAMDNEQRAVSEESRDVEKLAAEPSQELDQPQEAAEAAPAPMSKKQKKKAKKAKKSESLDLASQEPVSTPETTTPATPATNFDSAADLQEPKEISAEADNVPAPVDTHVEPETPQQVVDESQEQTEEPSTPVSSKKAKKDKKKKKKGSISEAQPEDINYPEVSQTTSEAQVTQVPEADAETPKAQEEPQAYDEAQNQTEEAPVKISHPEEVLEGAALGSAAILATTAESELPEPVAPESPEVATENARTEAIADNEWAEPSSKKSKKKKRKSKIETPEETVAETDETGEKLDVENRPDELAAAAPEGEIEQSGEHSQEQPEENGQEQTQEPPKEVQSPEPLARETATEETVATPSTFENAVDDAELGAAPSRKKSKKEKRKSKQAERLAAEASAMVDQQDVPAIENTEEKSVPIASAEDAIQTANLEETPAEAPQEEAISTPAVDKDAPETTTAVTESLEPAIEDKAEGVPDTVLLADTAQPSEANAEELWEEQPKKSKKKGKKNRKSVNLSESEPEPKASDDVVVVVDAAQAETPQPSGEAAETGRDVDHAAPAAAADVAALELLGTKTVHREISSVEQNEANDRQPHVSSQIKPDSEPQDDSSGHPTSTGQGSEKDKSAEDPQVASQDEVGDAPAAVTVAEADTAVVPIGEESPSDPAAPATEESKSIGDELIKEAVVEPAKEALPEDEFPMTPAQKKKAKKDKKKRQSLKEEEAPAPEVSEQPVNEPVTPATDETPVVRDAPVEENPEKQEEVTPEDEPVTEPQESKAADGEGVEEFQSAKSKKKAKKDKKKRQSLALSDEPLTPTTTEDLTEAGQLPAEESVTGEPGAAVEQPDQLGDVAQEPSRVEPEPAAQEDQTVPEQSVPEAQAVEDISNEPVEEFSSAKSKKKAKKDKKKRKSLALEEEQPAATDIAEAATPADELAPTVDSPSAPVVETESTEQPSLETATAEVPASEEGPKEQSEEVTTTETKDEPQISEPNEENAVAQQDTSLPSSALDGPQQATTEEPASPAVDEFQPAKSKKKGKKGKKNRSSISQSEELQEDFEKPPTAADTTEQTKEEQPPSDPSLEQTAEAISVPVEVSEEKPTEEPREERSEEPAVTESEDVSPVTAEREAAVVTEAAYEASDNNVRETPAVETEPRQNEQTDEKPDVTPESTAELATDKASELIPDVAPEAAVETATEPTTELKDEATLEADPEAEFATSKSKKKSKKDKKKRQSADWTEEVPAATAEEVGKAEGEDNKTPVDMSVVHAEETTASTEIPAEEGDGFMSAKAKRKAKKDKKKRQSVTWEDEISAVSPEPNAGTEEKPPEEVDISGDATGTAEKDLSSVDKNASAEEPKPVDLFPPQETPAEDDGKEKQSSEQKKTDDMENETDWTDKMASQQAEEQKEMSPVPPHQPPSESTDHKTSIVTPTTELGLSETTSEKDREEPKEGEEGSKHGEDATATEYPDQETSWMTPTKKSKKDKKKKKRESASSVPDEPSTPTDIPRDVGDVERSAPEEISSETMQPSESVPEDQPAIETEDAGIPEPSNPEEPPTAAAEDLWPSTTSQKKKNKKDKKNKKKQETAVQQEENANVPVELAEEAPAETAEIPPLNEDAPTVDKEAGVAAEKEIPAETSKEAEIQQPVSTVNEESLPELHAIERTGAEVVPENEKEIPSPAPAAEHELEQDDAVKEEDQTTSVPMEGTTESAEQAVEPQLAAEEVKEAVEAEPEEAWAMQSKKKKKDKKKRASLRDEEEAVAAPQTEEQSSLGDAPTAAMTEPGQEPAVDSVENQQGTEKAAEEPGEDFWAVSTKKGKKKGKKGKASQDISAPVPLETTEPQEELAAPVDESLATSLDTTETAEDPAAASPAAQETINTSPDDVPIAPEPAQASVSLDPFDVPSDSENVAEIPAANDTSELADLGLDAPQDGEALRKAQEESQDRLRRRALQQDSDLTLAEDLFGDSPRETVPESSPTKKSKKDRRKSLQKAIPEEKENKPEAATGTIEPTTAQQDAAEAPQEGPSAPEKSPYDEMLLNRSSSRKKNKKKRKDTISVESEPKTEDVEKEIKPDAETHISTVQEPDTAPAGEIDPFPNDDSWPPIEWDNSIGQNLEEQATAEEPSEEFPIAVIDHGPGVIGDFPDTPRLEELREETRQPDELSAEDIWAAPLSKKEKKKNKKKKAKEEAAAAEEGEQQNEEPPATEQPLPTSGPTIVEHPTEPAVVDQTKDQGQLWSTTTEKENTGKEDKQQSLTSTEEQPVTVEEKSSEKVDDRADETKKDEEKRDEETKESSPPVEEVASVPAPEPAPIISIDEKPREISPPPKASKIASIFPNLQRASFKRPTLRPSSEKLTESKEQWKHPKEVAEDETIGTHASRDSAIQVSEAPLAEDAQSFRDSGYAPTEQQTEHAAQWQDERGEPDLPTGGKKVRRKTSSVEAGSQDRPSTPKQSTGLHRTTSVHGHHQHDGHPLPWSLEPEKTPQSTSDAPRSLFGGPVGFNSDAVTPPRTPLGTIREHDEEAPGRSAGRNGTPKLSMGPEHRLPPPGDETLSRLSAGDEQLNRPRSRARAQQQQHQHQHQQLKTPEQGAPIIRPSSVGSVGSVGSITSRRSTGTPPLRRVSRNLSGDLRAASRLEEEKQEKENEEAGRDNNNDNNISRAAEAEDDELVNLPSSSTYDPVTDKGKRPVRVMADVYEGWGETPSSPRSPSRPASVRRRRSMQYLQELETRLDQLISENRLLAAARDEAEDKIRTLRSARRKSDNALNRSDADVRDKEAEITQLKNSLEWMQKEVARLTEENEGLTATNAGLEARHHQELKEAREASSRELEDLRSQHHQLSTGMEDIVRHEIESALAQKNEELRLLRTELAATRDKVQELQLQITASLQEDDVIVPRDEDYFDAACQKLCQHVQQWVLRFSKHSDLRRCRLLSELNDEKIADRFDNAILDGSDVDTYLADRVRRRDVFMSVVMTMVWEYIFTRYLFGMDREQRQKLKTLEKQLAEVGSRRAVSRWRATTLTLLARRPAFARQRLNDTEAVALEIFGTLSRLLPPPSAVEGTLLDSLRNVLRVAADLSIEMRTQRAEYVMLPPLQPEFDTNGDLARQVYFNASLMNERSGQTTSNEELEAQQAVVRLVLFPLVVKKGNDLGEGDEEIVVCPAQVLVARPSTEKKVVRVLSGDRMSIDAPSAMSNMI